MKKRLLLVAVVLMVAALAGSSALALAPMGPPTAGLKTGQFRVGFDYSLSKADIKTDWSNGIDGIFRNVKSNLFAANLGYGLTDDWEALVRLGVANAAFDKIEENGITEDMDHDFNGDYSFLYGFGTKTTWAKQDNLNWGTLFQMHWLNSKDTWSYAQVPYTYSDTLKIDVYEIQIALGPTWKVSDGLSIYGGPFFHFIGGDTHWSEKEDGVESWSRSANPKQKSCFGGYVGAQWDLSQNASVYGEFQFTGNAWTFGTGVGWKF